MFAVIRQCRNERCFPQPFNLHQLAVRPREGNDQDIQLIKGLILRVAQ
jgi:hypothetical protein